MDGQLAPYVNSPPGLQKQLDGIIEFVSKIEMVVNKLKTKIISKKKDNSSTFRFIDQIPLHKR